MTRSGLFVAALIVAVVVVWAVGHQVVSGPRVEPAPVMKNVQQRFPNLIENDSAARFFSTLSRIDEKELSVQREKEVDYLQREIASPAATTSPPPAPLSRVLEKNAVTLGILRAQLASNPPPVWAQRPADLLDPPQPDVILISRLFTTFAAHSLAEHNRLDDIGAWSDLTAMWVLARSLWSRPELPSVLAALGGCRMIAATASKLPAPAPQWWSDFLQFDPRRPLAQALEYEAWAARSHAERYPAGEPDETNGFHEAMRRAAEPFVRPLRVMEADSRVHDFRDLMQAVTSTDACGPISQAVRERWLGTVLRLNRFLVEREGVAKLLAAEDVHTQSGSWPDQIDTRSQCKASGWTYQRKGETMELAFKGSLPPPPQTRIMTPLRYVR